MIEARGLTVTFGKGTPLETVALASIDLAIPAGEFVTVIGSNGAGKTTLLNAIAGEVEIDRGALAIDGREVTRWPAARRAALLAQPILRAGVRDRQGNKRHREHGKHWNPSKAWGHRRRFYPPSRRGATARLPSLRRGSLKYSAYLESL